jgi:ABC-type iron transport system FetAB ATPase subunit
VVEVVMKFDKFRELYGKGVIHFIRSLRENPEILALDRHSDAMAVAVYKEGLRSWIQDYPRPDQRDAFMTLLHNMGKSIGREEERTGKKLSNKKLIETMWVKTKAVPIGIHTAALHAERYTEREIEPYVH